jgi:transitional endoplasmic reticulum ATPase
MTSAEALLPAQRSALDALEKALNAERVAELAGRPGIGKTMLLEALHARIGGKLVTARDFIEASGKLDPLAFDEMIFMLISDALRQHSAVIVDDFQIPAMISCCSHAYPRQNFLATALIALSRMARETGKSLVFGVEHMSVRGLTERVPRISVAAFTIDDYAALCSAYLSEAQMRRIDLRKVFRFAPRLDARQLRNTCVALRERTDVDTEILIAYLREHHMASNVDLEEVQAVELRDLKGIDEVIEALEANVILPLENGELSEELNLKPKRGVLLAGPPGTGKTTIGRALARRLKSKFFLIDGTVVSGTPGFHQIVHRIFEAAKHNAPAIIFIDDTDVVFEGGHETGFYRYLLTMLDGLESASAGRICLMMTAMDVGNLPPALVRSGRIELWLETHLPSTQARAAILTDRCAELPAAIGAVDVQALAAASEGLSGADLKRVVEDGKLLFAFARARGAELRPATEYFISAIDTVRRNKEQYAEAEARARTRHPVRPPYFDGFGGMQASMVAFEATGGGGMAYSASVDGGSGS